jgi:hypothetical protein
MQGWRALLLTWMITLGGAVVAFPVMAETPDVALAG